MAFAACSGDDDDDDVDTEARPVLEIDLGDGPRCLQVDDGLSAEVEELPMADCDTEHSHEVFALVDYAADDVYPGLSELNAFAETECLRRFEPFVGVSAFDSELSYSWLVPSLSSWNDHQDREVICTLAQHDGAPLVGTMRDSGR